MANHYRIGVAIGGTNAYVANEVARSISHVDLATQTTVAADIPSATAAASASAMGRRVAS